MITLVSRKKFPITIKYNGGSIMIPPQGKAENLNKSLLESEVPSGVQVIDNPDPIEPTNTDKGEK